MSSPDELCRSYLDLKWHFDPAAASAAGATAQDHRLGDFGVEAVREHVAAFRSVATAIEDLDVEALPDEIDRTALLNDVRATLATLEDERPHERNPEFWLSHLFLGLYSLLTRRDGAAAARAPAALDRLKATPAFLDAARATLDAPPSVFVDTALGMLGGGGELLVQVNRVFGAAAPELAEELTVATGEALQALTAFGRALRDEIAPAEDPLAFALGAEAFNRRLHVAHAIGESAAELWRYGQRLQQEVTAAVEAEARAIDPTRSWRDVVASLREETAPAGGLLDHYRGEVARSRAFVLERDLAPIPEGPLEVVPTPAFLTALIPFAAYDPPPTLLPDKTGRFYVTEPDPAAGAEQRARLLREHCVHDLVWTVVHEGYPGHHLQLVTAQGLPSEVRRHLWTPVLVEGWALYVENLMADEGYARGPAERLFRLVNLLWRAVRIVLDTGLHTRGMTPAQAVDYMVAHLPMERASAEAEVRRYCANPTYQLCYAVGWRDLRALRDAYAARAGDAFTLRRFHDELLAYGGLPVSLVRWGMGL
ncbi:MAG TPA: DUF885 domain-containing protein [Gemmatimonadales bacterium]|nr:DUF885 domain-containing protein [Gemmatimonadales bacterium]